MKKYRFPSQDSKDPEEAHLGKLLSEYVRALRNSYDPVFEQMLRNFGWQRITERVLENKEKVDSFVKQHGYLPSTVGDTPGERKLGHFVVQLGNKNGARYDEKFTKKHEKSLTSREFKTKIKKDAVDLFYVQHGYLPSEGSTSSEEHDLAIWLNSGIRNKNSGRYDEEFAKRYAKSLSYTQFIFKQNLEKVLIFRNERGYWPSQASKDKEEKSLGTFCHSIASPSSASYNSEIAEIINKGPTRQEFQSSQDKLNLLGWIKKNNRKPLSHSSDLIERSLSSFFYNHKKDPEFKKQVDDLCKELGI